MEPESLLAQGSTGKIEGRVRDQAGAPIANAQVFVVGTAFNALTNPQGYYFINNVPAGTRGGPGRVHRLQVDPGRGRQGPRGPDHHGGRPARADGGRRSRKSPSVTQTQPLVPRDEVTTKQRVDGQFADKLPVDRIEQVLAAAAGRHGGQQRQPVDPRRPQQRGGHLHRRRAGPGRATAAIASPASAGTQISRRPPTPSKRRRSPPGRPRPSSATPSRASSPSSPRPAAATTRARSPMSPTSRSASITASGSTGCKAASAARSRDA